jgi:hypothetical protein
MMALHLYLGAGPIRDYSPTYDEPVHLTAGYVYWKTGNYVYNGLHHPPLGEMWAAVPLLFMNPILPVQDPTWIRQTWAPVDQYRFADRFLYHNRIPADRLMAAGRWMQLLLSCVLGILIGWVAWKKGGIVPSVTALALWASSPTFLANGTVVSTDLAFAVSFFAFFVFLEEAPYRLRAAIMAGVALGFCIASKYFSLALLPSLVMIGLWERVVAKKRISLPLKNVFIVIAVGFFSMALVYGFSSLNIFWAGLTEIFSRSQAGRSSFFWGRHGNSGWLSYFPVVFLIKTPLPLLIALALAVGAVFSRKLSFPSTLWIPPLVFFGLACFSKVQIGHRHLLAVYPFLIVMAALGLNALPLPWGRGIAVVLIGWQTVSAWRVRPDFLPYFNEAVGGPSQGYRYLTDSNLDWGQGLKQLRKELTDDDIKNGIYLCYFGVADPHAEGITYLNVASDPIAGHQDDTEKPGLNPSKFAVSVTNWQNTYYADRTAFDWLKSLPPAQLIGNSLFLYDFSSQPEVLKKLESYRAPRHG